MEKQEQFSAKLTNIFGDNASKILEQLAQPKKYFSFRVNTLRTTQLEDFGVEVIPGPLENTFYCKVEDKEKISKSNAHSSGDIYIQGITSMTAVKNLGIKNGDELLDMCAAPGGKSAYAAALVANSIKLTALDNNTARVNAMRANLETLNVKNFEIKKLDATRAQSDPTLINRFDKIIADVPCSNEGLLRFNSDFGYWNPKLSKHLPMLQKRLLASAINCLKPGGTAVYSTCTYSPEENEEVVDWALKKFPGLALAEVTTEGLTSLDGFTSWKTKQYDPSLSLAKRLLPDDRTDGFFIAKLLRRS